MSSKEYNRNRVEVFENKGISPHDKSYNCHHIVFRCDIDEGRVRKDYPIDAVENLMPLKVYSHSALNTYLNIHPEIVDDISTRESLADLAEEGFFDYLTPIQIRETKSPEDYRRPKKAKGKKRGHTKHLNKHRR